MPNPSYNNASLKALQGLQRQRAEEAMPLAPDVMRDTPSEPLDQGNADQLLNEARGTLARTGEFAENTYGKDLHEAVRAKQRPIEEYQSQFHPLEQLGKEFSRPDTLSGIGGLAGSLAGPLGAAGGAALGSSLGGLIQGYTGQAEAPASIGEFAGNAAEAAAPGVLFGAAGPATRALTSMGSSALSGLRSAGMSEKALEVASHLPYVGTPARWLRTLQTFAPKATAATASAPVATQGGVAAAGSRFGASPGGAVTRAADAESLAGLGKYNAAKAAKQAALEEEMAQGNNLPDFLLPQEATAGTASQVPTGTPAPKPGFGEARLAELRGLRKPAPAITQAETPYQRLKREGAFSGGRTMGDITGDYEEGPSSLNSLQALRQLMESESFKNLPKTTTLRR